MATTFSFGDRSRARTYSSPFIKLSSECQVALKHTGEEWEKNNKKKKKNKYLKSLHSISVKFSANDHLVFTDTIGEARRT
jgi:hypothetical protein